MVYYDRAYTVHISGLHVLRSGLPWDLTDCDGYYSNCTANSTGTYQFNVNFSLSDTTTNDDSNGESLLEGSDLNVNAAAAKKLRPTSILRNRKKKILKASEMPAGAVLKMMANKQLKLNEEDKVTAYMTYTGNMTNIDYSRCDSLVPIAEPVVEDLHYKVNLLHSHEMKYRANLSSQDRVVGG